MALTAVTPLEPVEPGTCKDDLDEPLISDTKKLEARRRLTRPADQDNDLIKVAAVHGAAGILAVLRSRKDYSWFVSLCFRAIEVCLGPRQPDPVPEVLKGCDPVAFAMQILELEMIDELLVLMDHYGHLQEIQRSGLAIVEILVMDDPEWRDEIARKGGVALVCNIAKRWKNSVNLMCQVMTVMSYLAAEDYIEVMLCQHDALEYVVYAIRHNMRHTELVTRASLALLNLTVCEPHVEELADKGAVPLALEVMDTHCEDLHLLIILCGVLTNFSVKEDVRHLLVEEGVFERVKAAMTLDLSNAVLQVACLKALVNYSTSAEHYLRMEELDIPTLVGQIMVEHVHDSGVQRYGNYFLGQHTSCPII